MNLLKKILGHRAPRPEKLLSELRKMAEGKISEEKREEQLMADLIDLLEDGNRKESEKLKIGGTALHYLATIRFLRGDFERGLQALEKGLEENLFAMNPNEHLAQMGAIKSAGLWDRAILYGETLIAKYKEMGLHNFEMPVCGELGQLYKRTGDIEKSLEYVSRGYGLAKVLDDTREQAAFSLDMANLHLYNKNYDPAIQWAGKVLELMKEEPGNQRGYGVLASAYMNAGDLEKAEESARLGLKKAIRYKQPDSEAAFRMNLCEIYDRSGRTDRAMEEAKKAADLSMGIGNMERILIAQNLILEVAGKNRIYDELFTYLTRQILMLDRVDESVSSSFSGGIWEVLRSAIPGMNPDEAMNGISFVFAHCAEYIEKNPETGSHVRFFTEMCMMFGLWYTDRKNDALEIAEKLDRISEGEMNLKSFLRELPG